MDLKEYPVKFADNSSYLFCHRISYILRTGIIGYLLNVLLNVDFSGNPRCALFVVSSFRNPLWTNAANFLRFSAFQTTSETLGKENHSEPDELPDQAERHEHAAGRLGLRQVHLAEGVHQQKRNLTARLPGPNFLAQILPQHRRKLEVKADLSGLYQSKRLFSRG